MKNLLFIVFFMVAATFNVAAIDPLPSVSKGKIERISPFESKHVPARYIDVWLPPGYPNHQDYDVLYMHDGRMLFDATTTWNKQEWMVDEVAGMLIETRQVRPFIVVAIPNAGPDRHSEFFPQQAFERLTKLQQNQAYQSTRQSGQRVFGRDVYSDRYLKFIVSEVIPYIESNYVVNKGGEHRYLAGSSMGGLVSWYGLLQYPSEFAGAISMSTHWPGTLSQQELMFDSFLQQLQQQLPHLTQQKLYFDHGDKTLDALYPPLQFQVDQLLKGSKLDAKQWRSVFFSGGDHSELSWSKRLDVPLKFMFPIAVQNMVEK